jgi:predicted PurR-regulated permease PerM
MWDSIIFYIIISLLVVYIGHQLWDYIVKYYSKRKYVVSSQIEKYKSIIEELQEHPKIQPMNLEDIQIDIQIDMQKDLEDFLQTLQN